MSVLEPQPGHVGFLKAVSIRVQCSPLRPHFPGGGEEGSEKCSIHPIRMEWRLTSLEISLGHGGRLAREPVCPL
jgi:hypothetical protein